MFKKTVRTLILTLSLAGGLPCKQANAAFVVGIGAAVIGADGVLTDRLLVRKIQAVAGASLMPVFIYALYSSSPLMFCLDADGSINQDQLSEIFSKRYPFIDNSDTLKNLAAILKSKVPVFLKTGEEYRVALSEDEVRSALMDTDLTEENIKKIATDLQ